MVTLNNAEEISFDKLLIATGGSPRHLEISGAQLPTIEAARQVVQLAAFRAEARDDR